MCSTYQAPSPNPLPQYLLSKGTGREINASGDTLFRRSNANAMPLDYDCIANELRGSSDMIEFVVNDIGQFEVGGDTLGGLSTHRGLCRQNEKGRKACLSPMKRWGGDANALRVECNRNAIKESKVK